MTRIAVLASGEGTTTEALMRAHANGRMECELGLVVTNKSTAGIIERIQKVNAELGTDVEILVINQDTHPDVQHQKPIRGMNNRESAAILHEVDVREIGLVCVLGYNRVIRGELLDELGWKPHYQDVYQARMINTHPGILPQTAGYYGLKIAQCAIDLGLTHTAHTVHVVAEEVDAGPIFKETRIGIMPYHTAQTLYADLQDLEKLVLPHIIDDFASHP
jgi:phosphoribosylglycinamide formyltransferase-1